MKLSVALIASAVCLTGLAEAKVHRVGLKKIPQEDFSIVLSLLYVMEGTNADDRNVCMVQQSI